MPKGAVWWNRGDGHPCLKFFGAELHHQRWELRRWSLEDLHQASGLCRSFLCELEGGAAPTEEVILQLEAALGMETGGLMRLVERRWMRAVKAEAKAQTHGLHGWLARQARAIQRALKRQALAAWLASWLPWSPELLLWETALEG